MVTRPAGGIGPGCGNQGSTAHLGTDKRCQLCKSWENGLSPLAQGGLKFKCQVPLAGPVPPPRATCRPVLLPKCKCTWPRKVHTVMKSRKVDVACAKHDSPVRVAETCYECLSLVCDSRQYGQRLWHASSPVAYNISFSYYFAPGKRAHVSTCQYPCRETFLHVPVFPGFQAYVMK